jgi:hypothetical protein
VPSGLTIITLGCRMLRAGRFLAADRPSTPGSPEHASVVGYTRPLVAGPLDGVRTAKRLPWAEPPRTRIFPDPSGHHRLIVTTCAASYGSSASATSKGRFHWPTVSPPKESIRHWISWEPSTTSSTRRFSVAPVVVAEQFTTVLPTPPLGIFVVDMDEV